MEKTKKELNNMSIEELTLFCEEERAELLICDGVVCGFEINGI